MTTKEVQEILEKETKGLELDEASKNLVHIFTYYDVEDMMEELIKKDWMVLTLSDKRKWKWLN